jgi:endonuclease/exonuclease/phosphatase family metal-dependent hydrolase
MMFERFFSAACLRTAFLIAVMTAGMLPAFAAQRSLSVASWNLEWLADPAALEQSGFWTECRARDWPNEKLRPELPFCNAYTRRGIAGPAEYASRKLAALRAGLQSLAQQGVDVLAVQEVQNRQALEAVLPPGYRVVCMSTRADAQNVGFALRVGAPWQAECSEVHALGLEQDAQVARPVRRGLALTLTQGATRLAVLNVHLKSGCVGGPMQARKPACAVLQRQVPALEAWIESQARKGLPFIVVGDWNRDLDAEHAGAYPARNDRSDPATAIGDAHNVRNLLPEIDDGVPPGSALALAQVDRSASRGRACHAVLDHLAVSRSLLDRLAPASLAEGRLPASLLANLPGSSDHCALAARLAFR